MSLTPNIYPKVSHPSGGVALRDLILFLLNDHGSYTGPGWTWVDSYDAAGGFRETPQSDGTTLDVAQFANPANKWAVGDISAGSWIVLRSGASLVHATHFHVFLEFYTTTNIRFHLLPMDNYDNGLALSGNRPDWTTMAIPKVPATYGNMGVSASGANYSAVVDETVLNWVFDDGGALNWLCIQEVDASKAADTRPFVCLNNSGGVHLTTSGAYWSRLSPVDDTTVITGFPEGLGLVQCSAGADGLLGEYGIYPVGVYFTTGGHVHTAGWLRHIRCADGGIGARGTLDTKNYVYFREGYAAVAFPWDGVTDYP